MKKRIITILIIFTMLLTLFLIKTNLKDVNTYSSNNTIYLKSADETNKALFAKVKKLQDYAKSYIAETGADRDPIDLCLDFIRKDKYNDDMWKLTIGAADENFIAYVTQKDSTLTFPDPQYIIDKQTSEKVDFIHLVAALSANYTPNGIVDPSYAGWSGDLMTVLEEFVNYRTKNNITDKNTLQDYARTLVVYGKANTMGSEDSLANLDSLTMLKSSNFKTDLYQTLMDYYVNNKGTYNSKNRFKNAQNSFGSRDKLKTKSMQLIGDTYIQGLLIPKVKDKITSSDIEMLSTAFVEYVYREPFITLGSTNELVLAGETNKISLSGVNTDNIILNYNKNIVSVTNSGNSLNIKGLVAGKTDITIHSPSNTLKGTISVEVKNIAPSISTDLEDTFSSKLDEVATLKLVVSGTNNIYTWYISDDGNENWQVHSTTKTPELSFNATLELNGKFFKCGIKNEGNDEIFSKISMLNIEGLNPEIETNLPENATIQYGESQTFNFIVSGDDNTYTWYISDAFEDMGTELKITDNPEISIEGNEKYNNKYIKCIVTNTKTGKAITNSLKITVEGIPVAKNPTTPPTTENEKNNGIIVPIIIGIGVVVIGIIIFLIIKSKRKKNNIEVVNNNVVSNGTDVTTATTVETPTVIETPVVAEYNNVIPQPPVVDNSAANPTINEIPNVTETQVISNESTVTSNDINQI